MNTSDDNLLGEMSKGLESRVAAKETDGVTSYMAVEDGKLITGTTQDCTPIAEWAQQMHNAGNHGSKEMKLAAKLPLAEIEKYCNFVGIDLQEWNRNPVHIRAMLNNPELKKFRIWPGRV